MSIADLTTAPSRVGLGSNGMLLAPHEYDAITSWDDNYRYELVHGVLVVTPIAGPGERSPNDELGHLIRTYRDAHMPSVVDDTLPEQEIRTAANRRRADRAIWVGLGRQPAPDRDVPTIAVEFVSQSSRDRHRDYVEKRTEYAAAGVVEYWVVDRFRREMIVFRGAAEPLVIGAEDVYRTELLPGFELPLKRLLEKADRYDA